MLFLSCTSFVNGQYNAIFSFGDSYTDTGNLRILAGQTKNPPYDTPYGMTYFHHSTGRASDGRLVIDFIGTLVIRQNSSNLHMCSYEKKKKLLVVRKKVGESFDFC